MEQKKSIKIKDLVPIKELREEINLFMFNSKFFSTDDMKANNKLMEVLANVKIQVNSNN